MGVASKFRTIGGARTLTSPYKVKRPHPRAIGRSAYSLHGAKILTEDELAQTFKDIGHQPVIWLPAGFGDTHWIILKMQSMIDRWLDGRRPKLQVVSEMEPRFNRAADYLSRLPFADFGGFVPGGPGVVGPALSSQIVAHGPGFDMLIYANRHVEAGRRIEEWMPSLDVNWDYTIVETEEDRAWGDEFVARHGPFALLTFFNTGYYPETQAEMPDSRIVRLCQKLREELLPCRLFLTGGFWDRAYHEHLVSMGLPATVTSGQTTGAQMLALLRRATAFVGHQAGNTMLAHHLRCPTVLFWSRRWRNSPAVVPIDDNMWTCWVKPEYIGVIYDAIEVSEDDETVLRSIKRSIEWRRRMALDG